jgi:8-oxo-dGTP diphosphatase
MQPSATFSQEENTFLPNQPEDGYPRHIVAVMGLVTDARDRLLLVKGDRRGWEPPGGQVELGEDLTVALKREVREESGCGIEVGRLVGVYSNLGRPEKGVPEQINFAFSCRWTDGEPRAGDECTGAGWFSVDEALELVEAPQQYGKLGDALAASPGVTYRLYRTYPYEVLYERRC